MNEAFLNKLHSDLSRRLCSSFKGEYIPFDETQIKSMTMKETLLTLRFFQRDALVSRNKIEWQYNQYVQRAIEHKLGSIIGRDGTSYPVSTDFKSTLYGPSSKGGAWYYGQWYCDTQRVIPLLMDRLFDLEQELHPTD